MLEDYWKTKVRSDLDNKITAINEEYDKLKKDHSQLKDELGVTSIENRLKNTVSLGTPYRLANGEDGGTALEANNNLLRVVSRSPQKNLYQQWFLFAPEQ